MTMRGLRRALATVAVPLLGWAIGGCTSNKAAEAIRAQDAPRMVDLFRGSAGARGRVRASAPAMGAQPPRPADAPGPVCRCPHWAMWPCGPACVEAAAKRRADRHRARRLSLAAEGRTICRRWLFEWPCKVSGKDGEGRLAVAAGDGAGARRRPGPGLRVGTCDVTVEGGATGAAGRVRETALTGDADGVADYTRTVRNELELLFPRLPNPDILIYVYPHLATDERVPVPGYMTAVPLHERVEYALPGEMGEGSQ